MLLKDKFFSIVSTEKKSDLDAVFHLQLLTDCECYKGHFPGNPVSPGVCNIETIRECAELLLDKDLKIDTIKQCRLTAVAAPQICPEVAVTISLKPESDTTYALTATLADTDKPYMTLKAKLILSDTTSEFQS